jgi:hypothetical protein
MRALRFPLPLAVAATLVLTGCGTTSGLAWVHEPESGVDMSPPSGDPSTQRARAPAVAGARSEADERAELRAAMAEDMAPPRRIQRTITLGETTDTPTYTAAAAAPPGAAAPVTVNVYINQAPPLAYGPGYGYVTTGGLAGGFVRAPRAEVARAAAVPPAAMRPGLDWAPPPAYGPAFPYRMGPSSPWQGDGTDRVRAR